MSPVQKYWLFLGLFVGAWFGVVGGMILAAEAVC